MANTAEIRQALSMLVLGKRAAEETHVNMKTSLEKETPSDDARVLIDPEDAEKAERVQKTAKGWLRDKHVQGIGLAKRRTNDKETKELALKVYVDKKDTSRRRRKKDAPKFLFVDGRKKLKINGHEIPIDVEAIGKLELQTNAGFHQAPVMPGCSIFYKGISDAGTLGCLVRKRGTESPFYILSNSHVIADQSTGKQDFPIVQPGDGDEDGRQHEIARLFEWVKFEFGNSELLNTCDAAIAKVIGKRVSSEIYGLGRPPKGINLGPRRGMEVKKSGRSSNLDTHGFVKDVDFMTSALKYKKPNGGSKRIKFHHQVLCSHFTQPGDSGAVVLDKKNKVVGLHFAGSNSVSIFNRIGYVLNTFDIEIVTDFVP